MDSNQSNQSLNEKQRTKVVNPSLDEPCCDTKALQTELVTPELLSNADLAHVVGGANQESSRLDNPGLLHPAGGEDSNPFEPSPTYPSSPNMGGSPSHSSKE